MTYIFNIGARVDGHNVAVLHAQVVPHNTVQTTTAVVKIIVTKNDKDSVLSLLSPNEDRVAAEQLKSVHGVV